MFTLYFPWPEGIWFCHAVYDGDHFQTASDAVQTFSGVQNYVKNTFLTIYF
jgi:hypothetical protein